MDRNEFLLALRKLHLSPREAALLLSVDPKTVSRWTERGAKVPGPAEQALRAWVRLSDAGLPWRPRECLIGLSEEEAAEQIRLLREHNLGLDDMLRRVKARGGPAAPWTVDLDKHTAELGESMRLYFYALPDGGFSPSSYSRLDRDPNYERDRPLIEDAVASIAEAISDAGPRWHKRADV